jgi:hypothetical protein
LRAAQDFDTGIVRCQQVGKVVATARRGGIVQLHPIEQHDGVFVLGPANLDRSGATQTAITRQRDARRRNQDIRNGDFLQRFDIIGLQHRDRAADGVDRLLVARGGNDHVFDRRGSRSTDSAVR